MQALAAGVGDLKRVLTNVKSRGTWGEVQLARLIEDNMTPDQYASNIKPVPGSDAVVEFAIRLPGRGDGGEPVWLPIAAKFTKEEREGGRCRPGPGGRSAGKADRQQVRRAAPYDRLRHHVPADGKPVCRSAAAAGPAGQAA
ncbi:hypothetical protein G6F31_017912 [Rhizopus arrhizus]|nr:hypothetical protein G6F31_017912 [Rhizopus arrhizus]